MYQFWGPTCIYKAKLKRKGKLNVQLKITQDEMMTIIYKTDVLNAVEVRQIGRQMRDMVTRHVKLKERRQYIETVVGERQQLVAGQLHRHQFTETTPSPSCLQCTCLIRKSRRCIQYQYSMYRKGPLRNTKRRKDWNASNLLRRLKSDNESGLFLSSN